MPIAPRFHINPIRNFALQIARAPESIRFLQIQSTELLLKEIEEDSLYPFDYIVYRITGHREENVEQPMLLGSALLGDLVALIAIVSRTLDLSADGMLTIEQAAKKLNISTRTISRLRHEGLIFHWVLEPHGRRRLGCSSFTLEEFASRNKERILKASRFSRLTADEKQEVITLAMQCEGKGWSLSEVAATVAQQSTRGHETIRLLLQQTKATVNTFLQPSSLTRKDAREIEKDLSLGCTWKELTQQYQRTTGAIRKSIARLRTTRLKQMEISYVELDVFSRSDAEEIILGAPSVQLVEPPLLLLDSLEFNQDNSTSEMDETAIVSAMHLLRRRASTQAQALPYAPPSKILDRIETDLRWSFLLQQKLIIAAMPSALAVAVQHVGRPLLELPSNRLLALVEQIIQIVGEACSKLDPSKGQTSSKTPASVLDRNLPVSDIQSKQLRAAAKYKLFTLECPFHGVVPWSNLIPTQQLPQLARQTSTELETIVSARFGWSGRPKTIDEISLEIGISSVKVARYLQRWS